MLHAMSYQLSRGSPQSLWSALNIQSLQPLGEAAALALIAAATVRLATRPEWERKLGVRDCRVQQDAEKHCRAAKRIEGMIARARRG